MRTTPPTPAWVRIVADLEASNARQRQAWRERAEIQSLLVRIESADLEWQLGPLAVPPRKQPWYLRIFG